MKTYQLILKGGLTRNVEADGYHQSKQHLIFIVDGKPVMRLDITTVLVVEEIWDFEPSLAVADSSLAYH